MSFIKSLGSLHEIIHYLNQDETNIYQTDETGNTLFHLAVSERRDDIVQVLIQRGANLYTRNKLGKSALDIAMNMDKNEAILSLIYDSMEKSFQAIDGHEGQAPHTPHGGHAPHTPYEGPAPHSLRNPLGDKEGDTKGVYEGLAPHGLASHYEIQSKRNYERDQKFPNGFLYRDSYATRDRSRDTRSIPDPMFKEDRMQMEIKANEEGRSIFVCRLPSHTSYMKFASEMNRAGPIEVCHIALNDRGHSANFGFVSYVHKCDADWAVWDNQFEIDGYKLLVRPFLPDEKGRLSRRERPFSRTRETRRSRERSSSSSTRTRKERSSREESSSSKDRSRERSPRRRTRSKQRSLEKERSRERERSREKDKRYNPDSKEKEQKTKDKRDKPVVKDKEMKQDIPISKDKQDVKEKETPPLDKEIKCILMKGFQWT